MWHVSSPSGVATLRTAVHLLLTYYLTIISSVRLSVYISTTRRAGLSATADACARRSDNDPMASFNNFASVAMRSAVNADDSSTKARSTSRRRCRRHDCSRDSCRVKRPMNAFMVWSCELLLASNRACYQDQLLQDQDPLHQVSDLDLRFQDRDQDDAIRLKKPRRSCFRKSQLLKTGHVSNS